jgi:signal peptidase I
MSQSQQNSSQSLSGKEPWLAVNLSMFFPGIGQFYAGKAIKGWIFIVSQFLLYLVGIGLLISYYVDFITALIFFLITNILILIWSLFDAYRYIQTTNDINFEETRKRNKDPWRAVFLSRLIPGTGHLYIGKTVIGFILLVVWGFSLIVPLISMALMILSPFVVYHAYIASPVQRENSKAPIIAVAILSVIFPIVLSFFLAFFTRSFIAEARYIPAGSMTPTLQINDRVVIDKWSYHFQLPQRGDIVVFLPTQRLKQENFKDAFIKRVIGLPGEKVEIKEGKVYINNRPLEENYIEEPPKYQFGPATVPQNSYFMLGDNRNNSYDSHYWGFVPRENIIGKATKRFWPLDRSGLIK